MIFSKSNDLVKSGELIALSLDYVVRDSSSSFSSKSGCLSSLVNSSRLAVTGTSVSIVSKVLTLTF